MMLESERYWTCNLCAKCEICIEYILEGQTLPQHISFSLFLGMVTQKCSLYEI